MTAAGLTMKDFMKFDVINAAVATVLMGMSFGAIMPTLSPHLEKQLKLRDTAHVGMTYMIPALVYGVACPFVGAISDRLGYRKIIAMGFSMLTVAFIMMGAGGAPVSLGPQPAAPRLRPGRGRVSRGGMRAAVVGVPSCLSLLACRPPLCVRRAVPATRSARRPPRAQVPRQRQGLALGGAWPATTRTRAEQRDGRLELS